MQEIKLYVSVFGALFAMGTKHARANNLGNITITHSHERQLLLAISQTSTRPMKKLALPNSDLKKAMRRNHPSESQNVITKPRISSVTTSNRIAILLPQLSAISPNMINPKTKPKRLMIAVDSNFIF